MRGHVIYFSAHIRPGRSPTTKKLPEMVSTNVSPYYIVHSMSKRPIDEEEHDAGNGDSSSYAPQQQSAKRRRTYTEDDAKLAKNYEDLANDDAKARVSAAIDLVHKCVGLVKSAEDADREAFSKIQVRLIRGLCSNRKGARIGFSLAFTEVLHATTTDLWSGGSETVESHVETLLKLIKDQAKADYASAQVSMAG
jgi:hypothetical protein